MTEHNEQVAHMSKFASDVLHVAVLGIRDDAAGHEEKSAEFLLGMLHAADFVDSLSKGVDAAHGD